MSFIDESQPEPQQTMGAAILGVIGGVFSSVGSIWSSSNKIKSDKLELEQLKQQAENEAELVQAQALTQAVQAKQLQLAGSIERDKQNANLRGIAYVLLAGIVGWLSYVIFGSPNGKKTKK